MAKRVSESRGLFFDGKHRQLFATNRANVLYVMSSGLIRARSAYDKYYDDLLARCPGNILLFRGGFPSSLVPLLSGPEPGLFPVLVEVDPKRVPAGDKRMHIKSDLSLCEGPATARDAILCDVIGAPIPIAAVTRLCFASQDNLEDFQARDFDNVPSPPAIAVVTSAFSEGGPDPEKFTSVLRDVPGAIGSSDDFRRLDATMGAMAMLLLLLPSSMSWLKALAVTASFPNTRRNATTGTPSWLTSLTEHVMSPGAPDMNGLGVDDRLMAAAISLLRSLNPRDGWVEAKVASEIALRASAGAAPSQTKEIESWRDVVIAVAKADRQIGSLDDSGSVVRRGLMLLVLRCQPERIIRSSETQLAAGPHVIAVAGMLSGLFNGYSRLSRDIKTRACPPELLSRMAVSWWSSIDGRPRKLAIGTLTQREDSTTARVGVTVERSLLVERMIRPSDPMLRLFDQSKSAMGASEYDPELNAFIYEAIIEGSRKRKIIVEVGRPTLRGQATICVRTACLMPDGEPIRLSNREDAVAILELNHDPIAQCTFAVEPGSGHVEVLVHQSLETMSSPELQTNVESVNRGADEFEALWTSRRTIAPRRSKKERSRKSD